MLDRLRQEELTDLVFDDDLDTIGSLRRLREPQGAVQADAILGLEEEMGAQFSPELLTYPMPASVRDSFKNLTLKLHVSSDAWQALPAAQRRDINHDRFIHIALHEVGSRYIAVTQTCAEADLIMLLGLADRILGEDFEPLRGIEWLAERFEWHLDHLMEQRILDAKEIEARQSLARQLKRHARPHEERGQKGGPRSEFCRRVLRDAQKFPSCDERGREGSL